MGGQIGLADALMESRRLVIGTRGSLLARTQTQWVADALQAAHPDLTIETRLIQTQGDKTQAANVPLSSFGEKGIFAKELETALLAGEIDLAVHSMKDMAHTLPKGLGIAAVPEREDPRDCLVGSTLDSLPHGARVGTGSVRRRALLWSRRPDLQCLEVRGNIDTRLRKLRGGQYDALCLAVAGLNRLGLWEQITEMLDPVWFTPDPGQGALALETRQDDTRVWEIIAPVNSETAELTTHAERAFLRAVGGSCQTPVGANAKRDGNVLALFGMAAEPSGAHVWRANASGWVEAGPEQLGQQLADKLRAAGADTLRGERQ